MNTIQKALLKLADQHNIGDLTYVDLSQRVSGMIGKEASRQLIRFHLEQLLDKGLLTGSLKKRNIKPAQASVNTLTYSIPFMGNANCGEALEIADDLVQGYVQVSKKLMNDLSKQKLGRIFAVRAVGDSMNDATIGLKRQSIEDGDLAIIDPNFGGSFASKYMLSVIEGSANIKFVVLDEGNERVTFRSRSKRNHADIYLHREDLDHVQFAGEVIDVIKR